MTTPTAPTDPTDLRGHDLLRHVLDIIEREAVDSPSPDVRRAGRWSQADWVVVPPAAWRRAEVGLHDMYTAAVEDHGGNYAAVLVPRSVTTDCGTAMCFAGHTVATVGDQLRATVFGRDFDFLEEEEEEGEGEDGAGHRYGLTIRPMRVIPVEGGEPVSISDRARDLLGLTQGEADDLFCAYNTLADIRRVVASLVDAG